MAARQVIDLASSDSENEQQESIRSWAAQVPRGAQSAPREERDDDLVPVSRPMPTNQTYAFKAPAKPNGMFLPSKQRPVDSYYKHSLGGGSALTNKVKVEPYNALPGYNPAFRPPTKISVPTEEIRPLPAYNALESAQMAPMRMEDAEKELRELVESMIDMTGVDMSEEMPENLSCKLLPHQVQGIQWLKSRETGKNRGGILADDMGLGKTIQSIGLMLAKKPEKKPKTTLVVVPLALKEQWRTEIEAKTKPGALSVHVHHGTKRTKDAAKLMRYDVVITTYDVVASEWVAPPKAAKGKENAKPGSEDEDSDDSLINKVKAKSSKIKTFGPLFEARFHRVMLDEAHTIKGKNTNRAKACCELHAEYRWCLTGTSIQNSVEDLFSLFKFLGAIAKPFHEFPYFKEKILNPLKKGRGKVTMDRLQTILKALLLRRAKTHKVDGKPILELPARRIHLVKTKFLDADEEIFYKALNDKMQLSFNKFLKQGTVMESIVQVLVLLLRLRQACNHPRLVTKGQDSDSLEKLPGTSNSKEKDDVDDLADALGGLGVTKQSICTVCQVETKGTALCDRCEEDNERFASLSMSTKIRKMMRILEDIREENPKRKTIIFSQFISFFDLVEPFLKKSKIKYVKYIGSMPNDKREQALDRIKNDDSCTVILVSLKCGSLGLNLVACSRVIILDLWWNPSIENQGIDRAHRFGQKEDVEVYKITIEGTIEDRLLTLQDQKMQIANAALGDDGTAKLNKLSLKDIMFLFRGDGAS